MQSIKRGFFGLKMGVAFTISPSRPGRFRTSGTLMRSLRSWMAVAPRPWTGEKYIAASSLVFPQTEANLATVTLWDGEGGHRHGPRTLRPGEPGTVRPGEPYTAKHRRYEAGRVHALFYIGTSASDHMHSGLLLPESLHNKLIYTEPYEEWRTYPTWSPDGMRIAFASFLDFMGQFEIWAADTDGDNWVELTNGLGGREPAWRPVLPASTSVEAQSWGRIKSLLSAP